MGLVKMVKRKYGIILIWNDKENMTLKMKMKRKHIKQI